MLPFSGGQGCGFFYGGIKIIQVLALIKTLYVIRKRRKTKLYANLMDEYIFCQKEIAKQVCKRNETCASFFQFQGGETNFQLFNNQLLTIAVESGQVYTID